MNEDKNDVALADAPATVDGQKVLKVLQVSISDIPAEDGYKVILANAETASVPLDQFEAGATVTTAPVEQPDVATAEQAVDALNGPETAQPVTDPNQPLVGGAQ